MDLIFIIYSENLFVFCPLSILQRLSVDVQHKVVCLLDEKSTGYIHIQGVCITIRIRQFGELHVQCLVS